MRFWFIIISTTNREVTIELRRMIATRSNFYLRLLLQLMLLCKVTMRTEG